MSYITEAYSLRIMRKICYDTCWTKIENEENADSPHTYSILTVIIAITDILKRTFMNN